MITAARIAIWSILALLTTGPLIGYWSARKRYDGRGKASKRALTAYCTAASITAMAVMLRSVAPQVFHLHHLLEKAVPVLLLAALIVVPWSGPWIGCALLARAARRALGECIRCGYDLTGNLSGVCPECGHSIKSATATPLPARRPRRHAPWGRVTALWLGALALFFFLLGVQILTWGRHCPECGRTELYDRVQWGIPFTISSWRHLPDHLRPRPADEFPISSLLDPANVCTHGWMSMGSSVEGTTIGIPTLGPAYATCFIADEPDFLAFVAAHPEALGMMRTNMRNRRFACADVHEVYIEWREQKQPR